MVNFGVELKTKAMNYSNKKSFRLFLYSSCPIFGKLIFIQGKGYLRYFDNFGEINKAKKNCNPLIIQSIINQAEAICILKSSTLEKY